MINCLLTVAQCTLITNHSAAENGIFQQMICIRVIQIFSWKKNKYLRNWKKQKTTVESLWRELGVPGGAGEGSGAARAVLEGAELC